MTYYECLACKKPRTEIHDCDGPEGLPLNPVNQSLPQWIKEMDSYGMKSQLPDVHALIDALTIAWEALERISTFERAIAKDAMRRIEQIGK